MKRTYAKPVMSVERFLANMAVAACPVSTTVNPVTVNCLATSNEMIFSTGATGSGCNVNLDTSSNAGSTYCIYKDKSGIYWFIWPYRGGGFNGMSDAVPSIIPTYNGQGGMNKLTSVQTEACNAGYLNSQSKTGYHIAPLTSDIVSAVNSSY